MRVQKQVGLETLKKTEVQEGLQSHLSMHRELFADTLMI